MTTCGLFVICCAGSLQLPVIRFLYLQVGNIFIFLKIHAFLFGLKYYLEVLYALVTASLDNIVVYNSASLNNIVV